MNLFVDFNVDVGVRIFSYRSGRPYRYAFSAFSLFSKTWAGVQIGISSPIITRNDKDEDVRRCFPSVTSSRLCITLHRVAQVRQKHPRHRGNHKLPSEKHENVSWTVQKDRKRPGTLQSFITCPCKVCNTSSWYRLPTCSNIGWWVCVDISENWGFIQFQLGDGQKRVYPYGFWIKKGNFN